MENLKIKIKRTQEVEGEISIPKYFKVNTFWYCKMITESAFTIVNYYTDKIENITALELWPSIKVEHIRYLSWVVKGDNLEEITEEEFNLHLNAAKKLIYSL
jgi:heme oxygenase